MTLSHRLTLFLVLLCCLLASCGRDGGQSEGLAKVRLQTDWFPQGEHGGFYQALACGYYKAEGLDVEILPGGLTYMGALKVSEGQAQFAMHKVESILRHIDRGMPLRVAMVTLQHDPQGIMVHEDSSVRSFADLDGRHLIAIPGGVWLKYIERKYGISPVVIPSDKGMERFLSDPTLAQQCMVTSEPFFAAREGVNVRVLLLKDSGFDPMHVIYTSSAFASAHPEQVEAFVRASRRGWVEFLTGDPKPAFDMIKALNPRQNDEQLEFSRRALVDGGFAMGAYGPEGYGTLDPERMDQIVHQMLEMGMIGKAPDAESAWGLAPVAK
jgi:NitT/TauT family transport system substrate-binding protein